MTTQQAAELWPIIKAFIPPKYEMAHQTRTKGDLGEYEYNHPSVHDSEQKAIDEKCGTPGVKTIKFIEAT